MFTSDRQSALNDVIQAINSSLELDEVLRIVMDNIIRLMGAERGFLMLRNEAGEFEHRIARNWEQESIDKSEFAISRTIIERVVSDGQPVITTNAQEDPRFGGHESIIIYNLRSILCVPLKVKGELTGVIYVDNRIHSGIFSETERDLLATFANHAAVALENARLFDSVRRTLEEVTELKNLMDNVFASIASGVITADINHKISLSNRAAQAILGELNRSFVGNTIEDVLGPAIGTSVADEIFREIETVQTTDQVVVGREFQLHTPSRGDLSLTVNFSPLKDASSTTQGVAIVVDDLTEKKRLEGQRRLFERMVSPAVIDQLDPDQLQLGGKRAQICALFADIRGFTRFSEESNPEELVSVLNRYLAAAADAVLAQEGTIDKFMGDAIMAWFNAPIPQPDHALRAVRAALGLRAAVQRLTYELPPQHQLHFGAGIHFGEAVLGLVGTEKRLEYTAIGDSVNTAKRIQENSQAGQILISEAAYRFVRDDIKANPVEPILAKGKREPVIVYEIIGLI
jgi:PAS domain S-box-containing protein